MNMRKLLVVGGLVSVLALPAGIAVATTSAPTPDPGAPATTQPYGPGNGAGLGRGHGPMMDGDDRDDCPYYNSDGDAAVARPAGRPPEAVPDRAAEACPAAPGADGG